MGTLSVIIRIARIVWVFFPFLMTVVFNDRPIKEVLKENLLFTIVFFLLMVTTAMSLLTSMALGNLKLEYNRLHAEYIRVESNAIVNRRSGEKRDDQQCMEDYDPYRAIRELDGL